MGCCVCAQKSIQALSLQSVYHTLCATLHFWSIHALICLLQERLAGLPEGSLPLQDPSQPLPAKGQQQSLETQSLGRQSLERRSLERQLAQAEATLKAEQRQCDALREQAQQSRGCAAQAQLQLRRSHSRAERLAALVNEADQERRGYKYFRLCITVHVPLAALLAHASTLCASCGGASSTTE